MIGSAISSSDYYSEGDWLWIPLGPSRLFAVGRIARVAPGGKVITVYAFGPARKSRPEPQELVNLQASSADLIRMCGDLGIINRGWQVIPHQDLFMRTAWPMPAFGQWHDPESPGLRVEYPADAPNTAPQATLVTYEQARQLPPDGIDGYEAFEAHLCVALGVAKFTLGMKREPMTAQHFTYFRSERVAKSAANQMIRAVLGGTTEVRRSDEEWVVILTHRPLDDAVDFDTVVDRLTRIAAQRHGRYDGWERDA